MTSSIRQSEYPSAPALNRVIKCMIVIVLIAPILAFYALLICSSSPLPFLDDYESVLRFLNMHIQMHVFYAKTVHILTVQHAQYRLIFETAIFVAQRAVMGHVSFLALAAVGNSFVLIFFVLLSVVAFSKLSPWHRALLLLPAAYLLFQLQYAALLNWSVGSLQHFPLICFALLSLWLLTHESRLAFCGSCVALLLCVASSGNGFLLCVPGGMLLLSRRAMWRLIVWCGISALALGGYLYHYNFHMLASPEVGETITASTSYFIRFLYCLSFLGSSATGTTRVASAVVVGVVLLVGYLIAWKCRYDRINPTLFYFFLFILLTAFSVSLLRSSTLQQSLASRYRIYSALAITLAYIAVTELLISRLSAKRQLIVVSIVTAVCFMFAFVSDLKGYAYLSQRRDELRLEMEAWEHPELERSPSPPTADPVLLRHRALGLYKPYPDVLRESMRLGVYYPPDMR